MRFPGKYPIHQGETLHSVLQRAGGFTDVAFPEGAVFIREELKKREKEQLELLANRLQSDLAALSLEAVASSAVYGGGGGAAGAAQALAVGQQLMAQLRDTKPVGRLVIDIKRVLQGPAGRRRAMCSSRTATSCSFRRRRRKLPSWAKCRALPRMYFRPD